MKIVLYTNILTPYRKYFYDLFYKECKANGDDFKVLVMAETEVGRTWEYEDLKADYTELLNGTTFNKGEMHIHINKGIKNRLKQLKPDIVVCAGSYLCPGTWKIANLKKKFGYSCVYWSESHLNEERNYKNWKLKLRDFLRFKFYKKYDAFWYSGKLSKKFITKYCNSNAKLIFLPNLIDEKKYNTAQYNSLTDLREKYKIAQNKIVFFCPARLVPVKGICEFLELISESSYKNKATLLFAGDGPLKKEIKQLIDKYKLDALLLGEKNQNEIIALYSIADVFLLPSLSDANPLTCIEALWAGLPLLISNHCGNYPEVIKNGINGYVFNYEDVEGSVNVFDTLINSSLEWRKNAKETSIQIANNTYNSEVAVKQLHKNMKKICNEL